MVEINLFNATKQKGKLPRQIVIINLLKLSHKNCV